MPKGKELAEKEGGTQGHQGRKRGYWNRGGPLGQKEGLTEHGRSTGMKGGAIRTREELAGGVIGTQGEAEGGAIRTWEELAGKEGDS